MSASRSVRVRGRRDAERQARSRMGTLDAAVDHGGVDIPDDRYHARQLVGLQRARLGRLVVLGPVENASFMPWLMGTALIHSFAVTEKRGIFKSWTLLLAITAFSLSLLGTFLVRSGVLISVHAFASDPTRGYASGVARIVILGRRADAVRVSRARYWIADGGFRLMSREIVPAPEQHAARRRDGAGLRRHTRSAPDRMGRYRQDLEWGRPGST